MSWLEDIKKERTEREASLAFVRDHYNTIFSELRTLAEREADTINKEYFGGKNLCEVTGISGKADSFAVAINTAPHPIMTVVVNPEDGRFIIKRYIDGAHGLALDELSVSNSESGPIITFDPPIAHGTTGTAQLHEDLVARILVEPVLRHYLGLPQIDYFSEFESGRI